VKIHLTNCTEEKVSLRQAVEGVTFSSKLPVTLLAAISANIQQFSSITVEFYVFYDLESSIPIRMPESFFFNKK
jgi:hypothetical protein